MRVQTLLFRQLVWLSVVAHVVEPRVAAAQAPSLARLDASAEALIANVECNSAVADAQHRGTFGPPDSLQSAFLCVRVRAPRLGANFRIALPRLNATDMRLIDLDTGRRVLTEFDTTTVTARLDALTLAERVCGGIRSSDRERVPVGIVTDGDTIEVWSMPMSQFGDATGWEPGSVGGECGAILSPDGRRVVRVNDARDRWRVWRDSAAGVALIESAEVDLPLFSEVLAAHQLGLRGRSVAIHTKRWIYVRTGFGWLTTAR